MRARDKADNDIRHSKHEETLASNFELLKEYGTHFDSMATVVTMIIENINMQMEAELSDLGDRNTMSLLAAPPGPVLSHDRSPDPSAKGEIDRLNLPTLD